jgi:hypothetical protein
VDFSFVPREKPINHYYLLLTRAYRFFIFKFHKVYRSEV